MKGLTAVLGQPQEESSFSSGVPDVRRGDSTSNFLFHVGGGLGQSVVTHLPPRLGVGPGFADQEFRVLGEQVGTFLGK